MGPDDEDGWLVVVAVGTLLAVVLLVTGAALVRLMSQ